LAGHHHSGANKLRVVLEVSKLRDGIYLGTLVSVDQGAPGFRSIALLATATKFGSKRER
jgi:hypothetical protein